MGRLHRRWWRVTVERPGTTGWLLREDQVLASVELCTSSRTRARGLLGRDGIDGALLLRPASSVHTFGMRFPIDVAFCDRDMVVLRMVTMQPNRLGRPTRHARSVIEAEAGAFERWALAPGQRLDLRGVDEVER